MYGPEARTQEETPHPIIEKKGPSLPLDLLLGPRRLTSHTQALGHRTNRGTGTVPRRHTGPVLWHGVKGVSKSRLLPPKKCPNTFSLLNHLHFVSPVRSCLPACVGHGSRVHELCAHVASGLGSCRARFVVGTLDSPGGVDWGEGPVERGRSYACDDDDGLREPVPFGLDVSLRSPLEARHSSRFPHTGFQSVWTQTQGGGGDYT